MTLEELRVIINAETKGFRDEINKIKNQMKSATSSIQNETGKMKNAFGGLKRTLATLAIGATLIKVGKDSVTMAMQVEASIQQINRLMGDSSQKFKDWAKNNALAFNMSQSDALKFGSVYSNLLTSFMGSTEDVMGGTTELLKASAIVASGTGRTMEDVMERIRSGLLGNTEAIEDLGVDVRVGMLECTDAFKRFAGDASWDQLDVKTQQQIRLFAILEQTSQKFGDSVLVNTNSSLQQLVAILKDVALNIGNAFMPILNIVIPILSGFAMKLREVTSYIATFMSLLFGKNPKSSTVATASQQTSNALGSAAGNADGLSSSLGKAASNAKKTAKEMASLAGFDDLNILSSSSGADGGSGGSGGTGAGGGGISAGGFDWGDDSGLSVPEIDTSGIQKTVDKVKKLFGNMKKFIVDNKAPIISALAGISAGIATFFGLKWLKNIGGLAGILVSFLDLPGMNTMAVSVKKGLDFISTTFGTGLGKIGTIATKGFGVVGNLLMKIPGMDLAVSVVKTSMGKLTTVFSTAFSTIGNVVKLGVTKLSGLFTNLIGAVTNLPVIGPLLSKAFAGISTLFSGISTAITGVLGTIAGSAALIAAVVAAIVGAFAQLWQTNEDWKNSVLLAWENIQILLQAVWENVIQPIFNGIIALALTVWEGGLKPLWEAWVNLVDVISSAILGLWNFISPYVKQALEYLGPIFSDAFQVLGVLIGTVLNTVMGVVSSVFIVITEAIDWVVTAVAGAKDSFEQILEAIGQIFSGIIDFIVGVFTLDFDKAIQGIVNIFSGLWNMLVGIVSGVWNTILGLFANGGQIFSGVVDGIANVFKTIVNTLLTGINKVIAVPFKTINGLLNEIRVIDIPIIGKPFKGLWGKNPLPVPQIPHFATGAVVDKATLGVFGEAGAEAIVPLERNTGWIKKVASQFDENRNYPIEGTGGPYIIYLVLEDGTLLTKKVIKDIKDYQRRTGDPVFTY